MAKPRAFEVLWAPVAIEDASAVAAYLNRDSPAAASAALDRIEAAASRLRTLPRRGRVVPELEAHGIQTYRESIVEPWRIVYRIDGAKVWVSAVLDGRRSLEDILLQRFLRKTA